MSIRQPVGVAAIITPWNFPVAIPSWKIFPALVCGNTVVLKPAELTSACAAEFVKTLDEAGDPEGRRQPRLRRGPRGRHGADRPPGRPPRFVHGSTEVGKRSARRAGA